MKYSAQRELIKEKVLGNREHLTADDVYMMVKKDIPNISLATVYRNLNMLSDNGYIAKISFPDSCDRFDGCISEHCHLVCESCGKIIDIEIDVLKDIDTKVRETSHFIISSKQFIALGSCSVCSSKKS